MAAKQAPSCAKCGGRMVRGSILNRDSNGAKSLCSWVEGGPEKSVWTGLKTKGVTVLPIASFRCTRCGYLEHYAED